MSNVSAEVLVTRFEDQRNIKNLMGKYANCVILNHEHEIFDRFWSKEASDLTLAFNDGAYLGAEKVKAYYNSVHERNDLVAHLLQKRFPEKLGSLSDEELYGVGPFKVKPMSCPVIEIAGDRKTAKGLWFCQGAYNEVEEGGPVAYWTFGYFAVDFVLEQGAWKIWHLLYVNDVDSICGQSWGKEQKQYPPLPEFKELGEFKLEEYSVKRTIRPLYSPTRPLTLAPKFPVPYETFSKTYSYAVTEDGCCADQAWEEAIPVVTDTSVNALPEASLSDELADIAKIGRVNDMEEIKKVANKRVSYIANEMREEEIRDLWVSDSAYTASASFGRNTGYYVGMDAIKGYYVEHHNAERQKQLAAISAKNSSIANAAENLHIGCLSSHPISTGLVEIAEDGKTAKGMWYAIAQETEALPDGSARVLWMPEKVAIDFVKQQDGWKIWHIVIATDLVTEAGEDYSKQEVYHNYETNPVDLEFGTPTIAKLVHNTDFNWWDNYPPMPEAYASFNDKVSYGPEGYQRDPNYGLDSKEGGNWR